MSSFLLDVNVLVALGDERHVHHPAALKWFGELRGSEWGPTAFSQAGFLRTMTNPALNGYSVEDATEVLATLAQLPGYRFWPTPDDWIATTSPFMERVFGHQQITDAWLLGLAIKHRAVMVTFDKGIRHLAGIPYRDHVLILSS